MNNSIIRAMNLIGTAVACSLIIWPLSLVAETQTIFIDDMTGAGGEFIPNSVTIKPGDTVRWWAQSNEHEHTVVADDLSWRHEDQFLRWQWERQFDTPGEVRFHCDIHSSPGRDIDVFENGIIIVTEDDNNAPPFLITSAVSDSWFNPLTDGQGFFIIVWEDIKLIFLSWFTFDTVRPPDDVTAILGDAGQRWVTALGPYEGDTATLDVFLSNGGVFDSVDPPVVTDQTPIGTITIKWTSCNSGTLTYDFPSLQLSGSIPIERIVLDNVAACEADQPQR